jgi:hypothetical protein|tara:strand:- start:1920 stop:3383 length:1464 start_codon:yes stop_codon:yes gene_type:complete
MEDEENRKNAPKLAYEFIPLGESFPSAPTPSITEAHTEVPEAYGFATPTNTQEPVPAKPFMDRRGYTPTGTDLDPCITSADVYPYGNNLWVDIKTRGRYHNWWYKIDGGFAHLVVGIEFVTITNLNPGSHTIEIYLTGPGHRKYEDECTKKTVSFVSGADSTKKHILKSCEGSAYLEVIHRKEIPEFCYIEIDMIDYAGCWSFTSLAPGTIQTVNKEPLDLSGIKVKKADDVETHEDSCICCALKTCAEKTFLPIKKSKPIKSPPVPPITITSTEEFYYPPKIRCAAQLIVKKQTQETISVHGNSIKKDANLNVRGCPAIRSRQKYYVWLRRSDSCVEGWMNNDKPYIFEYISREECGCDPYLIPLTPNMETNLADLPQFGEEQITSLKLKNDGSPVYIVHMIIHTSPNLSAPNDWPKFYENYIRGDREEITTTITANNNTDNSINTTNLYMSRTEINENYFGSPHAIDVGKTISHINKIFLSEPLI